MATMATTHSLSVLTNSSVKPPLNPKTGLSSSLHERPKTTLGRYSGIFYDDYDGEGRYDKEIFYPSSTSKFHKTSPPEEVLQLSKLSDDEFYQKLLELKNEQRKILQKCEKVYIERHNGVIKPTFPDPDSGEEKETCVEKLVERQPTSRSYEQTFRSVEQQPTSRSYEQTFRSETCVDEDGVLVSTRRADTNERSRRSPSPPRRSFSPSEQQTLRDDKYSETAKPPTGRAPMGLTSKSMFSPPSRPRSAPIPRDIARSLDDLRKSVDGLRKSFEASDDEYIPDDTVSEPYKERDRSFSRIDEMWRNFSIDEYAPRHSLERPSRLERPASATITRKEKKAKQETWRHRLTIPKPFTMTMREESKDRKKSKNLIEFERKMQEKQMKEEEELRKKFKARPVPAHVYLPLYDEIQEKSEEKRMQVKQQSLELLKSQEKPFSFMKREEDRKQHQRLDRDCNEKVAPETPKPSFKARPVPKKVFDSTVDDKLMEEEEYRKIRIKMRAEQLLHTASLPPNMSARERLKEQKEREQKMKNKKKSAKNAARPKINHEVPNYDALYRHFQTELRRRKEMKEATVTRPFQLETERTSKSTREKIKEQLEKEEREQDRRWPFKKDETKRMKLGHISSSLDALPAKSTKSADFRSTKTKSQLKQLSEREMREIEEERHRRVREMRLRREIAEKTKYSDTPRMKPEDKKREQREAERARMEQYEKELQEMKERINKRPLLFEQETQINAKKKAEKKFNATLRSVGLDEEFIESRGSHSASVNDYQDDFDNDDDVEDTGVSRHRDETFTKHDDSDRSMSPQEA